MESFLGGRFVPLTFSIGFIEKPLAFVGDEYLRWSREHQSAVEVVPIEGRLPSVLPKLEPLTTLPRRTLLLATQSPWTAYFDNGIEGPDPAPPVVYLIQKLHCRGLVATCVPHTLTTETGSNTGTYGAVQFELFAPERREFLNYERSVGAIYEGGRWRFDANGSIQPFEDVSRYTARRITDRFTPEMLQRYCEALGVRIFDEDFYRGPGLLVVTRDPLPKGHGQLTLAEAQKQITPG